LPIIRTGDEGEKGEHGTRTGGVGKEWRGDRKKSRGRTSVGTKAKPSLRGGRETYRDDVWKIQGHLCAKRRRGRGVGHRSFREVLVGISWKSRKNWGEVRDSKSFENDESKFTWKGGTFLSSEKLVDDTEGGKKPKKRRRKKRCDGLSSSKRKLTGGCQGNPYGVPSEGVTRREVS